MIKLYHWLCGKFTGQTHTRSKVLLEPLKVNYAERPNLSIDSTKMLNELEVADALGIRHSTVERYLMAGILTRRLTNSGWVYPESQVAKIRSRMIALDKP